MSISRLQNDEETARYWETVRTVRDEALLDAARAVDAYLIQTGAIEGSTIHRALSDARHAVLELRSSQATGGKP